jgi:hypothetical protein
VDDSALNPPQVNFGAVICSSLSFVLMVGFG